MKIVLKLINLAIILCIIFIIGYIGIQVYTFYEIKNNEVVNLEIAKETYTAEYCKAGVVTSDKEAVNLEEIFTNDVIGYVESPNIDLKAAILEGDLLDNQTKAMHSGISHDPNSALPNHNGNVVLLGHRNFEFGKLKDIANENIIVLNIKDKIYVYEVYSTEVINKDEVGKVFYSSDFEELILYTCFPFERFAPLEERFVVKAKLIESAPC